MLPLNHNDPIAGPRNPVLMDPGVNWNSDWAFTRYDRRTDRSVRLVGTHNKLD